MLDYSLVENLLTAAVNDYMAQTANVRSYTNEEIADRILRSGAGLTKSDILSVLEAYVEIISDIIADGGAVNTPLFNAQPSIAGVFEGAGDTFDSSRHQVKINLSQGVALRKAIARVKTQKVQTAEPLPIINEVKDIVSGSVNDQLTKNSVVQLTGGRLKFLPEEAANGIFLVNVSNGAETKLSVIVENKPARLIAMIPADLSVGEYQLEVRTTYSTAAKPVKNLKTGRFNRILTVV